MRWIRISDMEYPPRRLSPFCNCEDGNCEKPVTHILRIDAYPDWSSDAACEDHANETELKKFRDHYRIEGES